MFIYILGFILCRCTAQYGSSEGGAIKCQVHYQSKLVVSEAHVSLSTVIIHLHVPLYFVSPMTPPVQPKHEGDNIKEDTV
jgi:hypothetical protein